MHSANPRASSLKGFDSKSFAGRVDVANVGKPQSGLARPTRFPPAELASSAVEPARGSTKNRGIDAISCPA
jgi:hypothetical protein